jgi:hypothetical protein
MRLLDTKKGQTFYSRKRTLCETIRELYDFLVIELKDNPPLVEEMANRLDEIFRLGQKVTDKLIELKVNRLQFFEDNTTDPEKIMEIRQERKRIIDIFEQNKNKGLLNGDK